MGKTLDQLEKEVPKIATRAIRQAYKKALAAGINVVVGSNGVMYEVRGDGSRVPIKKLKPEVRVQRGRSFRVN